jgi:hypothetical protein
MWMIFRMWKKARKLVWLKMVQSLGWLHRPTAALSVCLRICKRNPEDSVSSGKIARNLADRVGQKGTAHSRTRAPSRLSIPGTNSWRSLRPRAPAMMVAGVQKLGRAVAVLTSTLDKPCVNAHRQFASSILPRSTLKFWV